MELYLKEQLKVNQLEKDIMVLYDTLEDWGEDYDKNATYNLRQNLKKLFLLKIKTLQGDILRRWIEEGIKRGIIEKRDVRHIKIEDKKEFISGFYYTKRSVYYI